MHSYYIIVVGCGRLGGLLSNQLSAQGHQIIVIDRKESAFEKLSSEFSGFKILGSAIEQGILIQAGIEKADCVFSTTTEDNINLMVAQVAKKIYHVPHVIARVFDPVRETIYSEFDIETISPTQLSASSFLNSLESHIIRINGNTPS